MCFTSLADFFCSIVSWVFLPCNSLQTPFKMYLLSCLLPIKRSLFVSVLCAVSHFLPFNWVFFFILHTLSIIHPWIPLSIHPPLNVPTLPMVEFFFHLTHSSPLNCFLTISTVIPASLSSDIFKPSPWGEQKPASIWNQLFCSVHESRTKPWQKNSCKDRCVICFCRRFRLCRYQSIYCADVLQLWMRRGPRSLAAHQSCHKHGARARMARNSAGTNEIGPRTITDKKPLLKALSV